MKERPILFSARMVRAILDGSKTQTRRVAKGVHIVHEHTGEALARLDSVGPSIPCPYVQPGDRLWVRETWAHDFEHNRTYYRTDADIDGTVPYLIDGSGAGVGRARVARWRPSIHMPRWASRITLEITGVRVERVQDISEADAIAEGIERGSNFPGWYRGPLPGDGTGLEQAGRDFRIPTAFPKLAYRALWGSINGPGSWDSNPWVWVVEFKLFELCIG